MTTNTIRITVDLPKELHRIIKAYVALQNTNIKEFAIKSMLTEMKKQEKKESTKGFNDLTVKTTKDAQNNKNLIRMSVDEFFEKYDK